jgi:hypothetical protein
MGLTLFLNAKLHQKCKGHSAIFLGHKIDLIHKTVLNNDLIHKTGLIISCFTSLKIISAFFNTGCPSFKSVIMTRRDS